MKVGLMGFGKTGKAVASVLLESKEANLQWVIRKTNMLYSMEDLLLPYFQLLI